MDLFDSGHLDFATATSIRFSPNGFKRFYDGWENYAGKLLLRSQQVSNSPEIIRRLGVIGMNTPVEVYVSPMYIWSGLGQADQSYSDIYAHANSTCVMGSRILNGLGGSADFLRSSKISIMHTPSTRPSKSDPTGVSCIVPMCTHVDQTEHDLDVVVTEQVSEVVASQSKSSQYGVRVLRMFEDFRRGNELELSSTNAPIPTTVLS